MHIHGIIFVLAVASSVDAKKNKNKGNKNSQPNIIFILIDDLGDCLINAYNFMKMIFQFF